MKQRITTDQLKEIKPEILAAHIKSLKIGYLFVDARPLEICVKLFNIGKMIEILGDDLDSIDCYDKASEKPWIVMLYVKKDYIGFRDKDICDALFQATKAKLDYIYGEGK